MAATVTYTFQQNDVNGYSGTSDTFLWEADPNTARGAETYVAVDARGDDPTAKRSDGLIRFDDIFGSGPNQIPLGSSIISATLTLNVAGGTSADSASVHRMLVSWLETDTWNSWDGGDGVDTDNVEALVAHDDEIGPPIGLGIHTVDVKTTVQAWSDGTATNFGWAILHDPASHDGWRFDSSEVGLSGMPPILSITIPEPATLSLVAVGIGTLLMRRRRR